MVVYGCSVDVNLSVLNLVIVQKGEKGIPGLKDITVPRQLGTKKAGRIRKLFCLSRENDIHQNAVRKPLNKVKSPGPKHARFSILLLHVFCNTNADILL